MTLIVCIQFADRLVIYQENDGQPLVWEGRQTIPGWLQRVGHMRLISLYDELPSLRENSDGLTEHHDGRRSVVYRSPTGGYNSQFPRRNCSASAVVIVENLQPRQVSGSAWSSAYLDVAYSVLVSFSRFTSDFLFLGGLCFLIYKEKKDTVKYIRK